MCPIVSGNWNNSSNAGVWALNCNNVQTNSNENYSLRADSMPHAAQAVSGLQGGAFLRLAQAFAKSAGRPFSSSCHAAVERLGAFLS